MPKSISERPDTQVTPEPSLEKRTRRQFKPEYKLRIIAEADACEYGQLGALLRREKLYSSQLSEWRREFAENGEGMPLAPIIFGAPFNLEIGLGHRTVDIKTGI